MLRSARLDGPAHLHKVRGRNEDGAGLARSDRWLTTGCAEEAFSRVHFLQNRRETNDLRQVPNKDRLLIYYHLQAFGKG